MDGKVGIYKARLVVKGYKPNFEYEEIVSLVAMLKSMRILLSIVMRLNYEIW